MTSAIAKLDKDVVPTMLRWRVAVDDDVDTYYSIEVEYHGHWYCLSGTACCVLSTSQCKAVAEHVVELHNRHLESCWQPIDTAPKDGTEILVFCPFRTGVSQFAVSGRYRGTWAITDDEHEWVSVTPTHWMPLPAPPPTEKP